MSIIHDRDSPISLNLSDTLFFHKQVFINTPRLQLSLCDRYLLDFLAPFILNPLFFTALIFAHQSTLALHMPIIFAHFEIFFEFVRSQLESHFYQYLTMFAWFALLAANGLPRRWKNIPSGCFVPVKSAFLSKYLFIFCQFA